MFLIGGPPQGVAGNLAIAANYSRQLRLIPRELRARPTYRASVRLRIRLGSILWGLSSAILAQTKSMLATRLWLSQRISLERSIHSCPLLSQQRTSARTVAMSVSGQKLTWQVVDWSNRGFATCRACACQSAVGLRDKNCFGSKAGVAPECAHVR